MQDMQNGFCQVWGGIDREIERERRGGGGEGGVMFLSHRSCQKIH